MIRVAIIATLGAFLIGNITGVFVARDYYKFSELKAQVAHLKSQRAKVREVLGLNTQLDDEAESFEKSNQEVINAISRKASTAPDKSCAPVQCIDVDRMRLIQSIQ